MEAKLFDSYKDVDADILDLLNEAWTNPGPPVLRLDQVKNEIEYRRNFLSKRYRPSIHIGQRKLFMNELQFLNNYVKFVNKTEKREVFVIYAGGSPGHHIYELSRYYPNVTFIIIDPSRHQSYVSDHLVVYENQPCYYRRVIYYDIRNYIVYDLINLDALESLLDTEYKVFIIRELCTSELLLDIKKQLPTNAKIYLWSDIRTDNSEAGKFGKDINDFREYVMRKDKHDEFKKEITVTDGDILWNLAMQYNWLKDLEPEAAMFKFRLPFYNDESIENFIDKPDFAKCPELQILEKYKDKSILYPTGKIFLQPWQGISSTESRLVIKKKNITNLVEYSAIKYEAKFTYYNLMERVVRKHNNGKEYYKYGYCECNDCAIELNIFKDYINVSENKNHILEEFDIPNRFPDFKIIGNVGTRLICLLGTKLEGPNDHGINRY